MEQLPIETTPTGYDPTDRRPIAARRFPVFQSMASALVKAGVSANAVSLGGLAAGVLAGLALLGTAHTQGVAARLLWLVAAACIQLRLLANMLDGMVAIESRSASPLGELYNEIPDRVSDSAVLVGLGYAAGGTPWLGWAAALAAMLTAYIRAVGKAAGAPSDFRGPMAKQQRMFIVTVLAIFAAIAPGLSYRLELNRWGLAIIAVGAVLTCGRRLTGIARRLNAK